MGAIEPAPERIVLTRNVAGDFFATWSLIAPDEQSASSQAEYVCADTHQRVVEALRWYADERNWSHVSEHGTITTNTPARRDAGQRARDALKEL